MAADVPARSNYMPARTRAGAIVGVAAAATSGPSSLEQGLTIASELGIRGARGAGRRRFVADSVENAGIPRSAAIRVGPTERGIGAPRQRAHNCAASRRASSIRGRTHATEGVSSDARFIRAGKPLPRDVRRQSIIMFSSVSKPLKQGPMPRAAGASLNGRTPKRHRI